MLTFDDAREIVRLIDARTWTGPGTFYVSTVGREDDTRYLVPAGAYEDLVEHRLEFLNFEPVARFVDKETGVLTHEPLTPQLDQIAEMREVESATV